MRKTSLKMSSLEKKQTQHQIMTAEARAKLSFFFLEDTASAQGQFRGGAVI
jgi:hypothetical protein